MGVGAHQWLTVVTRGRKHSHFCDHRSSPLVAETIFGGCVVRCLKCGKVGPVRETSKASRAELIGSERGNAE